MSCETIRNVKHMRNFVMLIKRNHCQWRCCSSIKWIKTTTTILKHEKDKILRTTWSIIIKLYKSNRFEMLYDFHFWWSSLKVRAKTKWKKKYIKCEHRRIKENESIKNENNYLFTKKNLRKRFSFSLTFCFQVFYFTFRIHTMKKVFDIDLHSRLFELDPD